MQISGSPKKKYEVVVEKFYRAAGGETYRRIGVWGKRVGVSAFGRIGVSFMQKC
jgi:hypothetical protein